jgi:hypothetical protein
MRQNQRSLSILPTLDAPVQSWLDPDSESLNALGEFFSDEQIMDVDSPGLTTPNLKRLNFKALPRPVWPIDDDVVWKEPDWA